MDSATDSQSLPYQASTRAFSGSTLNLPLKAPPAILSRMRFIAACPDCQVQYWSDEADHSQSVHCYCGATINLNSRPSQEARVVRCSSCGAGREGWGSHCSFCQCDFTIHEKDLNTVCPQCVARISDSARFCHYCGVRIAPQADVGKKSSLGCPACNGSPALYHRSEAGHFPFHECHRCAGVWLGLAAFEKVLESSKSKTEGILKKFAQSKVKVQSLAEESSEPTRLYRRCPICDSTMLRRHVAPRSGIILDFCKSHGVWFDGNELSQLVHWIRREADEALNIRVDQGALRTKPVVSKKKPQIESSPLMSTASSSSGSTFLLDTVFDVIIELID